MPTLIVTTPDGQIKEDHIRIHHDANDACMYALSVYGKGKFVLKSYTAWIKSRKGIWNKHRIATLQKLRRFRKPTK